MSAATNPLQQILQLSQQMLKLAEDDKWEEIVDLDEQRHRLISATFPLNAEQLDISSAVTLIKHIMELDERVTALGTDAKQNMATVLSDIQKGRQATNAYHKVGR